MTNTVAIWKDGWLPSSETFISEQLAAMRRWNPIRIGFYRVDNGLPEEPDVAPYSRSVVSSAIRYGLGVRPYRSRYVRALRGADCTLIHAHFGQGGVHALPLSRYAALPLMVTFHGQDASSYGKPDPLREHVYRRGLQRVFREARCLVAVSEFVANQLLQNGAPNDKVKVVYIGTRSTPAPGPGTRDGILFVGRLIELKGVDDLIMAIARARDLGVDATLNVVGDGPVRPELEKLASSFNIRANFLGWQPNAKVRQLMERSALFCAPSHRTASHRGEGFGMVYAEAAMQELPIIAYAAGGALEAVEHGRTGYLVPERDIRALSDAIVALHGDPVERARLGQAGRKRAIARFNLETQSQALEHIYDEVSATS